MSPTTTELTGPWEVCVPSLSWYRTETLLKSNGDPETRPDGTAITRDVRKYARKGELIELSERQADHFLRERCIQRKGAASLYPDPQKSLFSQPLATDDQGLPYVPGTPPMGDPRPAAQVARNVENIRAEMEAELSDDEDEAEIEEDEVLDPETASAEELAEWIKEDKPNVGEVLEAAGDDADIASKLLEAEGIATGGSPRRGVTDGLSAVIKREE